MLPSGRYQNELSGEAYLYMRHIVGRPLEEPYLSTVRDINRALAETRSTLRYGRGNVTADLEKTQNESYIRRNQERRLTNSYVMKSLVGAADTALSGAFAARATACFSRMAETSNCGGHAATGAYLYLQEKPLVPSGPSVVTIAHKYQDHNWFEVRYPRRLRIDTRVVGDAWAGGPAVMSADSRHAANPGNKILHRWENADIAAIDSMTIQFSDMKPEIERKVQEQLANRDTLQVVGTIYNRPQSVISEEFALEVQAALARTPRIEAPPELMRETNRLIAHALGAEYASTLDRSPDMAGHAEMAEGRYHHAAEAAVETSHSQPTPPSGSQTGTEYWAEVIARGGVRQENPRAQTNSSGRRL